MRTAVGMSSGFTAERSVGACGVEPAALPIASPPLDGAGAGVAADPAAAVEAEPAADPAPEAFLAVPPDEPVPATEAAATSSDERTTAFVINRMRYRSSPAPKCRGLPTSCVKPSLDAISFGIRRL